MRSSIADMTKKQPEITIKIKGFCVQLLWSDQIIEYTFPTLLMVDNFTFDLAKAHKLNGFKVIIEM